MPWARFYVPQDALTQEDKAAIAKGITDIYAEKYPRGGVLVSFFPFDKDCLFKGGEVSNVHSRITLQHMKGTYSVDELENDFRMRARDIWKPYINSYELQISEIPGYEVSLDDYIANSFLGDPMLKEMIKTNKTFPIKSVPA